MRPPRLALLGLCIAILIGAALHTGHSVQSMDGRTYAQMMHGISEHGLPYWDNGPIDRFTALVVQWGVPSRGHIWGIYSPFYPYLSAPAFRLGGLLLVSRFTFALLTIVACSTYLLAKRFVENEWYAALAAFLAVVSTPMLGHSLELTPFPLTAGMATLALYFTTRVVSSRSSAITGQRREQICCGIAWAMACSTHILSFPMAIGAFAIVALAPPRKISRLASVIASFLAGMLPMAALNHLRFDSWNPISYGPIPWTGAITGEGHKMTLVNQLRYSAPAGLFVVAVLIALWLAMSRPKTQRQRTGFILAIAVSAIVIALAVPPLRERFTRYAMVACGYIIDMTVVDMGSSYPKAGDGIGRYFASALVKSTLQATPILIVAPAVLIGTRGDKERRWLLLAILVPCTLLYLSFITRANLSYPDAMGWPCIHIRYTFPALPALVVASMVVVERIKLRLVDFVLAALVALVVFLLFQYTLPDLPNETARSWRRSLIVLAPLVLGALSIATVIHAKYKQASRLLLALTMGLGVAIGTGHDLYSSRGNKNYIDEMIDRFTTVVPPRFALIGKLGDFDLFLSTTTTHDVEYADVLRLDRYEELIALIEHWRSVGRPIYFVTSWHGPPYNPWPNDVVFRRLTNEADSFGVYSVDRPTATTR